MTEKTMIADRYELGERLGHGGMSTVCSAFDSRLERKVAIKLLAEHLASDPQFVSRFRREALAAAQLVHPNIVQVFDFGLDQRSERHFIVMELISGRSILQLLREKGRLGVAEVVDILDQAARGLAEAHRHGVVHRDIKPANLLRSDDDRTVKVADFGIARIIEDGSGITQVGSVIGTAAYLAPEQAMGVEATPRSDLYALGVVAYQLLSGGLPYEASSLSELALKQQREAPPLLSDFVPGVSDELSTAVDRALALDPADRFASADAMRSALTGREEPGAGDTQATTIAPAAQATTVMSRPTQQHVVRRQPRQPRAAAHQPPPQQPPPKARRRGRALRRLVALVLVMAAAAAGIGAYAASTYDDITVRLRSVDYEDARQVLDELRNLIDDNIR